MRTTAPVALALLAACSGPSRLAEQGQPRYDVHQVASRELLRQANHGRDIEGPDGRYVLPRGVRRAWIDVGAHLLEQTRAELERNDDVAVIAIAAASGDPARRQSSSRTCRPRGSAS